MKSHYITIVGATGNVGRQIVSRILAAKLTLPNNLNLLASEKSAGQVLEVQCHPFVVGKITDNVFQGSDIVLFATESDISTTYIPAALKSGAYVIDSSSAYRLDKNIPLIIPPVNNHLINSKQKLYAHANCLASPIATVVSPLHKILMVKRIQAVTYQATSGAGKAAMDELKAETENIVRGAPPYTRHHFKRQIAFNVIPQVGDILPDGFSKEEFKIIHEIQKVVDPSLRITATAVRVPVKIGHSISLALEFESDFTLDQIRTILKSSPSVQLSAEHYTTPIEVEGKDDVFVGRLRHDPTVKYGIQMWLCSDNLRRGAATDAFEILSKVVELL